MSLRGGVLRRPAQTLYVGGGSPTCLESPWLARLLALLAEVGLEVREYTFETNPADLDERRAAMLAEAGVNRLSVGAQSFVDTELAWLGRRHRGRQIGASLARARRAGIGNLSLDLIYGFPGQGLDSWQVSLAEAVALEPEHISCYCLSLDETARLSQEVRLGQVQLPADTLQEEMYFLAVEALGQAGYEAYELSNFARDGHRSEHNQVYWRNEGYVGLGPSAASYIFGRRSTTCADVGVYVESLLGGSEAPAEAEMLVGRAHMAETVMLLLRMREGIDRRAFAERFGVDVAEAFASTVRRHQELGTIELREDRLRLVRGAWFVADAVLADFLAEG
jgi:oxygen-independent coproporphyrinogen-3 oxidase